MLNYPFERLFVDRGHVFLVVQSDLMTTALIDSSVTKISGNSIDFLIHIII